MKKKWSLRSISFSRKDKPKQEKKQKEEEPKTNGEPEKVPEEVCAFLFIHNMCVENQKTDIISYIIIIMIVSIMCQESLKTDFWGTIVHPTFYNRNTILYDLSSSAAIN